MTVEEVLQAAFEMVVNNDHVSLLVLADMLEEAGMDEQAKQVRTGVGKIPTTVGYEVQLNGRKYQVDILLSRIVIRAAIQASRNWKKKTVRMGGDISATLKDNLLYPSYSSSKRQRNTLPLSALQGVDLNG